MTIATSTALAEGFYKGLPDLKIAKLLTDASGQTPTYGSWYDAKIMNAEFSNVQYDEVELLYDERVGDTDETLKELDFTIEIAALNQDILAILDGSTTTTTGTAPNRITTNLLGASDKPSYFKLELSTLYDQSSSITDKHVTLYKCKGKVTGGKLDQSGKGYTTFTISGKARPLTGIVTVDTVSKVNLVRSIRHLETAVPIA